jgi:hypothetical protein
MNSYFIAEITFDTGDNLSTKSLLPAIKQPVLLTPVI